MKTLHIQSEAGLLKKACAAQNKSKKVWAQACLHDGVSPEASFVILSKDNPFAGEVDSARNEFVQTVQTLKEYREKTVKLWG